MVYDSVFIQNLILCNFPDYNVIKPDLCNIWIKKVDVDGGNQRVT
jgi:hypothetical protein